MSKSESGSSFSCGCFGCLVGVVGFLGLVYIIAHWAEIWDFIVNSPFPL